MVDCLGDTKASIRAAAADYLGRLGPAAAPAVPKLTPLLDDLDVGVRLAAADALLSTGPSSAGVEAVLTSTLRTGADADRVRAANILQRTRRTDGEVVRALVGALGDRSREVRLRAAESLVALGVEKGRAVTTLIDLVAPGADDHVGSDAASVLARAGDEGKRGIRAIRRRLSKLPPSVDSNLLRGLVNNLVDLGAIDELIELLAEYRKGNSFYRDGLFQGVRKLIDRHPDRIPKLVPLLRHEDAEIRQEMASLLGTLGPTARPALAALEALGATANARGWGSCVNLRAVPHRSTTWAVVSFPV